MDTMLRLDPPYSTNADAEDAVNAASPSHHVLRAHALAALALPVHAEVPLTDAIGLGRKGLELAVSCGDPLVLAFAASNLGVAALAGGRRWGWRLIEQALDAATQASAARERARIVANGAHAALWLGDYRRARRYQAQATMLALELGCQWLEKEAALLGAEIAYRTEGRITLDLNAADESLEPPGAYLAGRFALAAGDLDWAELLLLPLAERGFYGGYPDIAGAAAASLAGIALQRGDGQAAISWAGRAVVPARAGAVAWWGDTLPAAASVLVRHDMVADAEELLADAYAGLVEAWAPRAEAALEYARGIVAEGCGRHDEARDHYLIASQSYQVLPEGMQVRAIEDGLLRLGS